MTAMASSNSMNESFKYTKPWVYMCIINNKMNNFKLHHPNSTESPVEM